RSVLRRAGKLSQARDLAAAAHARAQALELAWLAAEALLEVGRAQAALAEDLAVAEQTLADAVWAAEAAGAVDNHIVGFTGMASVVANTPYVARPHPGPTPTGRPTRRPRGE